MTGATLILLASLASQAEAKAASSGPEAVAVTAPGPALVPRLAFYSALGAADLGSTEFAVVRGHQEANPLIKNRAIRIAAVAGVTVATARLDQYLTRHKHRKSVWVVRGLVLSARTCFVIHNLRQASRPVPGGH